MLRIGVIGFGKQGQLYSGILSGTAQGTWPVLPKPKDCLLTAVSARSEEARVAVETIPPVQYFKDWRDLIASDACDAVVITVPHLHHHEIAIAALEAGKHVLCEKPMTIRASDAEAIVAAAERNPGSKLAMMLNQRSNPLLRKIKHIIDSGELGQLRNSYYLNNNWWRPDNYYTDNNWRGTWKGEGGGILVNQAPHPQDLWIWLCGMPQSVYAVCREGAYRNIAVENDVMFIAKYPNGTQGIFTACSHDLMGTDRLELAFDKGKIVLENNRKATILRYADTEQGFGERYDFRTFGGVLAKTPEAIYTKEELTDSSVFADDYVCMFENFAAHVLRGEELIATGYAGLEQVRLANAIRLSGWTGREIQLPCDTAEYDMHLERKMQSEGQA